jgi:hypothetical protein
LILPSQVCTQISTDILEHAHVDAGEAAKTIQLNHMGAEAL